METVEFSLPATVWKGIVTKFPADTKLVESDEFTNGSHNFVTSAKGIVTKRGGGVFYNPTAFASPNKDQYEAVFSNGVRHLLIMEGGNLRYSSGGGTFALVTAGYTANGNMEFATYKNRVYFGNGIDNPQVYDIVNSYGGVGYSVPKTKEMGAQAPSAAPTFAADTAGGAVPAGAHTYKVTFLYYDSQESNGGPASGVHTVVNPNNTVNLTAIPIGGYGVTARKIYRDNNDSNYTLVGTISNNTATTFSDIAATGTLPINLDNGLPPLFSLIINHRDRLWVSGVTGDPSTIYWSEAGLPDIFMSTNRLLCNPRDPIVALAVYNDKVLVLNRNSMGQILGSTSADFRYSEISPSVGCVDNRSVQIRTVRGVPTIMWLANDNFYQFNGSSINAVAEDIQDQLQLNIQQALQVKGKNTQSSQADFLAGTASPGIDLTTLPGNITTKGYTGTNNPTKLWDTEAEWENGSSITNVATNAANQLSVPIRQAIGTFAEGTYASTEGTSALTLVDSSTTSQVVSNPNGSFFAWDGFSQSITQSFIATYTGTITLIRLYEQTPNFQAFFPSQIAAGGATPPNSGFSAITLTGANFQATYVEFTCNPINVVAGTRYWLTCAAVNVTQVQVGGGFPSTTGAYRGVPGSWVSYGNHYSGIIYINATVFSPAGQWTGPTKDSLADNAVSASITHTGSYPSGTGCTTTIEAANDAAFTSGLLTQSTTNLNGSFSLSLTGRRYWRVKLLLTSSVQQATPSIGLTTLAFNTTGTWISEVIDHTTDITSLDLLNLVASIPAGSATITIATSSDNITYSPFTSLGSAVALRYSKIQIVLTSDGANSVTPTVSSAQLNWSLVSNFISQVIDTGSVIAGWDLFQDTHTTNGGTILFEMRTASTVPGLTGATWFTVTNGAFITAPPNQFAQWRVTITSHANQVPIVDSVTLNWLVQDVASIRVASLFFDRSYYLAAAEYGQTFNNIVFVFDENNTWKVFRGLNINTMGTFFNDAYYGSSTIGKLVKWLDFVTTTDQGTNIELDLRTKAFSSEVGDETKTKFLRHLVCKFVGTGARITPSYSIDGGMTFLPLANVETGLAYFDTANDGRLVAVRFAPASSAIASGRTLMLRLYNNDDKAVEIHSMRAKCWISPREVLHG